MILYDFFLIKFPKTYSKTNKTVCTIFYVANYNNQKEIYN